MVIYERRNVGSITASFKPRNLEACEAFRAKVHRIWKEPSLQELSRKAGNNYCYVLLDRVALCEKTFPNCPELKTTIRNVYEDFEQLKASGIEEYYVNQLDDLFKRYKKILKNGGTN